MRISATRSRVDGRDGCSLSLIDQLLYIWCVMSREENSIDDPHALVPRGVTLSVDECVRAGVTFHHLTRVSLRDGLVMRSRDFRQRPQYELFRKPPSPEFYRIARFLSDRRLEAAFEEVRRTVSSSAPSRKTAIFAFLCEQCAMWFRDNSSLARKDATIVRLSVSPSAEIFVTDLVWRNLAANVLLGDRWKDPSFPFPSSRPEEALRRVAEAYWRGENPDGYGLGTRPEALIEGEVVVAAR